MLEATQNLIIGIAIGVIVATFGALLQNLLNWCKERRKQKALCKELLKVWVNDMIYDLRNLQGLEAYINDLKEMTTDKLSKRRRWDKLVVDSRPLDRLEINHFELTNKMTAVRCQIMELNRLLDFYDLMAAINIETIVRTTPIEWHWNKTADLNKWINDFGKLIDEKREKLLPSINELKKNLEEALHKEGS